jgi:hypothetical protein
MLFVEKGLNLIRLQGLFSQIFPNKFCLTISGKGLRQCIDNYHIDSIVDFGTCQVFEGAINYVMIPIIRKVPLDPHGYTFIYRQKPRYF